MNRDSTDPASSNLQPLLQMGEGSSPWIMYFVHQLPDCAANSLKFFAKRYLRDIVQLPPCVRHCSWAMTGRIMRL